jgi:hypothetical protein
MSRKDKKRQPQNDDPNHIGHCGLFKPEKRKETRQAKKAYLILAATDDQAHDQLPRQVKSR